MSAGLKQLDAELNSYGPSDRCVSFILNYSKSHEVKKLTMFDAHLLLN